jgi:hypothetical protein
MRSLSDRQEVEKLLARGASDYAIAAITSVPRSTVGRWRRHPERGPRDDVPPEKWRPLDPSAYAYLLGLYLGDGCLGTAGSPLTIALDARYPGIVAATQAAIEATVPGIAVHRYQPIENLVRVVAWSPLWPRVFPQHGPGRKHTRPIELVDWQIEIAHAFPKALLRGLVHSDGCRTTNRFKVKLPSGRVGEYEYPRYFFSNLSKHIRQIFCDHCDLLGIRWTQSNPRNISISHRKSVALLDEFIGPKW